MIRVLGALLLAAGSVGGSEAETVISPLLAQELSRKGFVPAPRSFQPQVTPSKAMKSAVDVAKPPPAVSAVGVLVKFRDPLVQRLSDQNLPPPDTLVAAVRAASQMPVSFFRAMSGGAHVFRFSSVISIAEAMEVAESLRKLPQVELVDLDALVTQQQSGSVDPYVQSQWNMKGPLSGVPGGIDAFPTWPYTYGTSYPIVAVVDTGVLPHPEFASRLMPGYDFVSDTRMSGDGDGRDSDAEDPGDWTIAGYCGPGATASNSSWHGTHVAGIIGADGRNGAGMAGAAWDVRILPVRVLGKCGGLVTDIIDGIRWAAGLHVPGVSPSPTPAHIVNVSLGGYSPAGCAWGYQHAINEALGQGVLVVVAAGNYSHDAARYVPANCRGVLTVFATDYFGGRASYSNIAFTGGIAAPGGDMTRYGPGYGITSTVGSGTRDRGVAAFAEQHGTSMAAPHVSGVAALALSANPNLTGQELAALMMISANPFAPHSLCNSGICGAGIVSAFSSVVAAKMIHDRALIYEFYNSGANHFFRTGAKNEAAAVNRGSAGPGWYDTVNYFYAWSSPALGTVPVCRFYSPKANSHFYTAHAAECEGVKNNADWNYEGISFYAKVPVGNACQDALMPVYRVYNNRHGFNDQNHRFTTNLETYQAMVNGGWRAEGVAFCV